MKIRFLVPHLVPSEFLEHTPTINSVKLNIVYICFQRHNDFKSKKQSTPQLSQTDLQEMVDELQPLLQHAFLYRLE